MKDWNLSKKIEKKESSHLKMSLNRIGNRFHFYKNWIVTFLFFFFFFFGYNDHCQLGKQKGENKFFTNYKLRCTWRLLCIRNAMGIFKKVHLQRF